MSTSTKVAVAVVESAGRVLVGIRPADTALAGKTEFPGGKIDSDEAPRSCVVRECREETGLVVVPKGHLCTVTHEYEHDTVELHFWKCELAPDMPADKEPQAPFRWASIEELSDLDFPEANQKVLAMLNEAQASHE